MDDTGNLVILAMILILRPYRDQKEIIGRLKIHVGDMFTSIAELLLPPKNDHVV
jgi:hypothetical protein